jgi:hypothetical protein
MNKIVWSVPNFTGRRCWSVLIYPLSEFLGPLKHIEELRRENVDSKNH